MEKGELAIERLGISGIQSGTTPVRNLSDQQYVLYSLPKTEIGRFGVQSNQFMYVRDERRGWARNGKPNKWIRAAYPCQRIC